MNTTSKKKAARKGAAIPPDTLTTGAVIDNGRFQEIPLGQIDISPLNYRKHFNVEALEAFAGELKLHGIISPVTLRPAADGRFELVAGERRYRAAGIAGIDALPAIIKQLTDEQVTEIQLAENLQRENPHPMHEAFAVRLMQDSGKTIEEITLRLGKSKGFVYSRIRLTTLIDVLQEIFLADKLTLQQAFDIAALAPDGQNDFYESHCTDWQDEGFNLGNIRYLLDRYKYDLTKAPFDTADGKLLPEAGACTNCPFNSATLRSLFPEMAKEAICSRKSCYRDKCDAHLTAQIKEAVAGQIPDALLFTSYTSPGLLELVEAIPELNGLSQYCTDEVTLMQAPEIPDRGDYTEYYAQDDEAVDEESFAEAMDEYHGEVEEFNALRGSGTCQHGLYIRENQVKLVLFRQGKAGSSGGAKVTAKEVQQAIKGGTATPQLLQSEISRITAREQRAKEIDRDKVQLQVHELCAVLFSELASNPVLTTADHAALRLVIYQSLGWEARREADNVLLKEAAAGSHETLFERLAALTEPEFCYLVRLSLVANSESKHPQNAAAHFLYKVAEEAGLPVSDIEAQQQEKAEAREGKANTKVRDLKKRIALMESVPLP